MEYLCLFILGRFDRLFDMNISHVLDRLRLIDDLSLARTLSVEDKEYVLDMIKHPHPHVVSQAAVVLTSLGSEMIAQLLERFPTLSDSSKRMIVPLLGASDTIDAFIFLLDQLKESQDPVLVALIVGVLAKTDYAVLPSLLVALDDDDKTFRIRLTAVFKQMGFDSLAPQLAVFPVLPHERFFRDVYGHKAIDDLYRDA